MQFEIEFFSKNMDFLPALALTVSVEIPGILGFFDLILLKLHVRPSLNQFVVFVLRIHDQKISCFFAILTKIC